MSNVMFNFTEGQQLEAVWYVEGQQGYLVGHEGCTKITVVMENGQMGKVPWAYVETAKGDKKLNLALMEEVELPKLKPKLRHQAIGPDGDCRPMRRT